MGESVTTIFYSNRTGLFQNKTDVSAVLNSIQNLLAYLTGAMHSITVMPQLAIS